MNWNSFLYHQISEFQVAVLESKRSEKQRPQTFSQCPAYACVCVMIAIHNLNWMEWARERREEKIQCEKLIYVIKALRIRFNMFVKYCHSSSSIVLTEMGPLTFHNSLHTYSYSLYFTSVACVLVWKQTQFVLKFFEANLQFSRPSAVTASVCLCVWLCLYIRVCRSPPPAHPSFLSIHWS